MSYIYNKVKALASITTIALLALVATLSSCNEENDSVEEYPNWQTVNETYWKNLYAETQTKIDGGDTSWKIIPAISYSMATNVPKEKCIIVHVNKTGNEDSGYPLLKDSVRVHYRGHLLPSTTYTSGFQFDSSWNGDFNEKTAVPAKLVVNSTIDGWQTALQHMLVGDDWDVYIPYQLGYGTSKSSTSNIPGYSTLIFRIILSDFWHPGEKRGNSY